MRSSSLHRAFGCAVLLLAVSARAEAQQQSKGFALERFYPSAPGGAWFVMEALETSGGLGGAMSLTTGYAKAPLRIRDGSQNLAVVSDQAFTDLGVAVTYDRFRLYFNVDMPLVIKGQSGTVGGYAFTAPPVDLGSRPDTLSDARIGFDLRFFGTGRDPFRLGAGAQLFVPNGNRADYDTDDTYRVQGRLLFAGDVGIMTYAGHLGGHLRPLSESSTPGSPQGSELLFGFAGGARLPLDPGAKIALIVGTELYGATAARAFLGSTSTALEGLLVGRLEGTGDGGPHVRAKLGVGAGLNPHFGAPEWRVVFAIEVFDHTRDAGSAAADHEVKAPANSSSR